MSNKWFGGLAMALMVLAAACGDTGSGELPVAPAGTGDPGVAGACVPDEPACEDTFLGSGEPTDAPRQGVPVAEVIATNIDGGFAIEGYYFSDEAGVRLCEVLAESFPPQCGGASIFLDNSAGADLGVLTVEQGITWSETTILVVGQVVDGVFVAD